jgi:hypothetical protein
MPLSIDSRHEYGEAWDCNPLFIPPDENVLTDIDLESDDWQIIALDRFHDRIINSNGPSATFTKRKTKF